MSEWSGSHEDVACGTSVWGGSTVSQVETETEALAVQPPDEWDLEVTDVRAAGGSLSFTAREQRTRCVAWLWGHQRRTSLCVSCVLSALAAMGIVLVMGAVAAPPRGAMLLGCCPGQQPATHHWVISDGERQWVVRVERGADARESMEIGVWRGSSLEWSMAGWRERSGSDWVSSWQQNWTHVPSGNCFGVQLPRAVAWPGEGSALQLGTGWTVQQQPQSVPWGPVGWRGADCEVRELVRVQHNRTASDGEVLAEMEKTLRGLSGLPRFGAYAEESEWQLQLLVESQSAGANLSWPDALRRELESVLVAGVSNECARLSRLLGAVSDAFYRARASRSWVCSREARSGCADALGYWAAFGAVLRLPCVDDSQSAEYFRAPFICGPRSVCNDNWISKCDDEAALCQHAVRARVRHAHAGLLSYLDSA